MDHHIEPVRAAVQRLSGLPAHLIDVRLTPATRENFVAAADGGRLTIEASTPVAAIAGYAQFARTTGVGSVSRSGIRPLQRLPEGARRAASTSYRHRVAYNITVAGYTTPFFSWSDWERELDILAASAVNAAHITLGQEMVWLEAFSRLGFSESELLAWIVPPSHQPWQWLNNIQGFGGGTSRPLIEARADLARRVLDRMSELGIEAILPGFSGTVPPNLVEHVPGAQIVPQGKWFMDVAGAERPDWLRSDTTEYADVAAKFYRAQRSLFDRGGFWAVDLLHEGGKIGDATLADAAKGVEAAMRAADPGYTWVVQAWGGNPRRDLLDAVDREHVLILDLTGEHWGRMEGYGASWAWGILPNYGGRNGLYGDLASIASAPRVLQSGDADVEHLVGLTDMAEGVANNPVVWDLFHDLTWTDQPIDLDEWFTRWVAARYGAADESALEAWRILREHAYGPWRAEGSAPVPPETGLTMMGLPVDPATVGVEQVGTILDSVTDFEGSGDIEGFLVYFATDSVISAVPSLSANQASLTGPRVLGYEPAALQGALAKLIDAADVLPATPSLEYDLVDVARQVLVDAARILLPQLRVAFDTGDAAAFDSLTSTFLGLIDVLDDVLATHPDFRLDTWVDAARASAGDDERERKRVVEWALRLLTTWGERGDAFLVEYSNRDWAGLVGGYYRSRWERWFNELRAHLRGEQTSTIDWYTYGEQWIAAEHWPVPAAAGDPLSSARRALGFVEAAVTEEQVASSRTV